jgi:hypothetical protein
MSGPPWSGSSPAEAAGSSVAGSSRPRALIRRRRRLTDEPRLSTQVIPSRPARRPAPGNSAVAQPTTTPFTGIVRAPEVTRAPVPRRAPKAPRGAKSKVRIGSAGSSLPISRAQASASALDPGRRRGERPSGPARTAVRPRALSYSLVCPTAKTPLYRIFPCRIKDKLNNDLHQTMSRSANRVLDKTGEWAYN